MDAKYCAVCKQHGGAHNTHNMGECHKYEKDRTPKKTFTGKSKQCNRNVPCKHNTSYAQLSVKIAKLEKSNKKLKVVNKKCKCSHDSDSNDSNSS